jgi:hypothetical protein
MSSALNVVQIEANRRNARQSTGPRTEVGKKISSLNALRHGLTSCIVVLPTEDLAAYKTFSEEFLVDLAPETFAERQYHAALTAAAAFRDHSQAFVNLSMHEQRLYRILKDASKSLEDLKAKRIASRQADLDAAVALHNLNKMQGVPSEPHTAGFVFKPEEIEAEYRRRRRLLEAKIAQECHYDRKKFHQHPAGHPMNA